MNMVFGRFDFTPETGELRREGRAVKLQAQPAKVLAVLLAHAGEIVTRDTLQREVWGDSTHVDFERGLNFCIAQVRSALGDTAESPRYVETVPRQGYRFIAPLSRPQPRPAPAVASYRALVGAALLLILVFGGLAVTFNHTGTRQTIAVIPYYNETGRQDLDQIARALADTTVVRLATPQRIQRVAVIGNAEPLRNPFARDDVRAAAKKVMARWVVIGQLQADERGQRLVAHLIRVSDMKHVWAQTYDSTGFNLDEQARTAETIAASIYDAVLSN
jgi:DNA-binding winged helix-turn-helix (wHTH) protein/TolB-like protein